MSAHTSKQSLQLLDLPNEVISHILAFCDSVPPSRLTLKDRPSYPRVYPEASTPLKKASTLNHRLRKLALPFLFRNLFVSTPHLDDILAFTSTHRLDIHVSTAQIYLPGASSHQRPPWWTRILDQYSQLSTLIITAPPNVFAEIVSQPIKLSDQWAFKIPCQTLQLSHSPSPSTTSQLTDHTCILHARPWTSLLVNEGSSLMAYTTYEYFLRNTPSPLGRHPSTSLVHLLQTLTSFTFVATFPMYSHIAEITDLIQRHMPALESLTVKLLPDPDSSILLDSLEASGGHFDVRDPWSEFETSVSLLGHAAEALSRGSAAGSSNSDRGRPQRERIDNQQAGGRLRELRLEDVQMTGVRDTIEATVTRILTEDRALGWMYPGDGLWVREPRGAS